MVDGLSERDKRLVSVQSPAVMEYTAGTQHVKAKEDIVARRARQSAGRGDVAVRGGTAARRAGQRPRDL